MPSSQASKGKPGKARSRDSRSLSRATTPSAPVAASGPSATSATAAAAAYSPYLHTSLQSLLVPPDVSIEALIERHSSSSSNPPSGASLLALREDIITRVLSHVHSRADVCDKGMRELSRKRKDRIDDHRAREERDREEDRKKRERQKQAAMVAAKKRQPVPDPAQPGDEDDDHHDPIRPPAVGAHGLARQDGLGHRGDTKALSPSPHAHGSNANGDAAAAAATTSDAAPSPSASEASHQPAPAPAVAHYETFGEDPTQFDDPTVYHIRDLTPDLTEEEKKEILCVARYPHDDLNDLTPGTPPDMDFSNAKPPNQINFSTFQAYVEPYIRPLTEEDVAFLKERGDRLEPYMMPKRGTTYYRDLWAKEDGLGFGDSSSKTKNHNEPRGSIEDMNDDKAETDDICNPPVVARLLQVFRHEPNTSHNDSSTQQHADVSMVNGEATAGNQESDAMPPHSNSANDDDTVATFKPATFFPEVSGTSAFKVSTTSSRDLASLDQRTLQELRYSGFLTPEASPDFDSYYDDEVAERLRHLQSELRYISRENGARKARVLELTEERMAMQEYSTIADDLDSQINTAYLKRNRTMSKPKKGVGKGRPGQAGGTGGLAVSRNAVSEGVRMLMDRRKEWKELIGPVVDFGQTTIPRDTVFDKSTMERLDKSEAEAGDADVE